MFWLKGCRRCGGDVYTGEDIAGKYLGCMQCGHYLSDDEARRLTGVRPQPVAAGERRESLRATA